MEDAKVETWRQWRNKQLWNEYKTMKMARMLKIKGIVHTTRYAQYWIFANIRYADIFQQIFGLYRLIYFLLFGSNTKYLLCKNSKQNIFNFG